MGTLNYLGIFEGDIESGASTFAAVCEHYGIDEDKAWRGVLGEFEQRYDDEFSNTVSALMMEQLREELAAIGIGYDRTEYEVNGLIVDFYVDGEQV